MPAELVACVPSFQRACRAFSVRAELSACSQCEQLEEDGSIFRLPRMSPVCPVPVHDVSLKAGTDIAESPRAGLARHEDGLRDVVKHLCSVQCAVFSTTGDLQQELGVGTGLCGALYLAGVELAALLGLEDPGEGEAGLGGGRHLWMVGKRAVCRKSEHTLFM